MNSIKELISWHIKAYFKFVWFLDLLLVWILEISRNEFINKFYIQALTHNSPIYFKCYVYGSLNGYLGHAKWVFVPTHVQVLIGTNFLLGCSSFFIFDIRCMHLCREVCRLHLTRYCNYINEDMILTKNIKQARREVGLN